jgi:hypothetical protein
MNCSTEIILEIINYCDKLTKIKLYRIINTYDVCCDNNPDDWYYHFCSICKSICCEECYENIDIWYEKCINCYDRFICSNCNKIDLEELYCDKCVSNLLK